MARAGLKQAMPSSKRKGIPGRCSLPADFMHNPSQRLLEQYSAHAMFNPLLAAGLGQPVSLAQLQQPALALTYPNVANTRKAAESVKSILVARTTASFPSIPAVELMGGPGSTTHHATRFCQRLKRRAR